MVACRKVVVFGLVVLIGSFPVLATVDHVLQVPSSHLSPSIPLPAGKELGDDELLDIEGEIAWWIPIAFPFILGIGAAGGAAVHENWFDEDYGIDRNDVGVIVSAGVVTWGSFPLGYKHLGSHKGSRGHDFPKITLCQTDNFYG